MAQTRAAIRYAKAVLSLANEQNSASKLNDDMKSIVNAVAESKDLSDMLQSPVIHSKVKKATLLEVFPNMNKLSVKLIDLLVENKRIDIIDVVAQKINMLFDESQGTQIAKVTTAIPLTKELEAKVLTKVKELTGNDAEVQNTVDESILGGFILRVGDIQYNASIANKLDKLKREFTLN
ncbi:ATP synthase F1 subunit delta [Flavobacteriaceae bacterium]|jgi:F-type H+-transporting ATPase subunit delta|nr:ATP synthase F1 subunit delta [Flavobacteriaceae bacterium]MCP4801805.1 ATP synthase F1 subunit delta [Bacteroidota bacterium]MDB2612302.1 ATP synthase F1 subunit delta [Flavobacteriaceae bacterium]MDC3242335.1 ATP synthase F1 subunit delta [Flavobacteriaceae bacterium]MDC3326478.1 ATP synthase F1 subunit delta [Flavobacteriaceae bacterium]